MSPIYPRPLIEEGGDHRLAGGWLRFSKVELLSRQAPPRRILASDLPPRVLHALTAERSPIAGLAMDRPRVMGIVNVTPDSFSDGGLHEADPAAHGRALIAAGADLLDIGGESTRPGAAELPVAVEIDRILPSFAALAGLGVPLSVDTRKSAVASAAMRAGATMINDVSGLDFDPAMAATAAGTGAALCIMHARGEPQTMQDDPRYDDVVLDVFDALAQKLARAEAAGVARSRIVLDPGIGFGKTLAHNLAILRNIALYHALGCPLLLGVSRKGFIGRIGGADAPRDRMPGTLGLTLAAVGQGVQMHRVHDVAGIVQGLRLWQAVTTCPALDGAATDREQEGTS